VIYVFAHDSIFLGEDGPTHQPISQLLSLRAIPRLTVIRPADANETVAAWAVALRERDHPTALILSRQKIPILPGTADRGRTGVARGGYVLAEAAVGDAVLILLASGSEVSLALEARQRLEEENIPTRVVSLPSWELFEAQNAAYRESVLPSAVRKRLAIEAGVPLGWERYVGDEGEILGIDRFGASAPYRDLEEPYGFTVDQVVRRASALLGGAGSRSGRPHFMTPQAK
jgi:transketolase